MDRSWPRSSPSSSPPRSPPPYLYMMLSSFKTPIDNITLPPKLFFTPTLDNYRTIFENVALFRFLRNTIVVATAEHTRWRCCWRCPPPMAWSASTSAGGRGSPTCFWSSSSSRSSPSSFPTSTSAAGSICSIRSGFSSSSTRLWNVPWGIWLVRGFIQDVPRSLRSRRWSTAAAALGAMLRVTLPLAAPGLTAAAILLFIGAWNEFTLAFFLTSREARTYPTSIGFFLTHAGMQWGEMFATALIGTLPVVIFAFLVRKTFISSLSFGAVKG